LEEALKLAVDALASVGGDAGKPRQLPAAQLEVAVLDRGRPGRTFRRLAGAALTTLLNGAAPPPEDAASAADTAAEEEKGATPRKPAPPSAEGVTHSPGLRPPPVDPTPPAGPA
jgi:proteasome alpha subunit